MDVLLYYVLGLVVALSIYGLFALIQAVVERLGLKATSAEEIPGATLIAALRRVNERR